ncbi:MAG: sugar-transfer associated ATP-grasp domain-containing protein [Lachnospiraceae bacterium]|nr:sugar-transfer associated ATP-grasp domain-containing protein [Lachnospiraceae bacterium]
MNKSVDLEALLQDGFSRKFANYYIEHANKEIDNPEYDVEYVKWAHSKGFLAESAYAYALNDTNYMDYLSDYDYYKIWPLNSWSRIWVNDKLTLQLLLGDKKYEGFMPKYYYYSTPTTLKTLTDTPYRGGNLDENFMRLLSEIGEFACKPCNGTGSAGFFRLSFNNDKYYINDEESDETEIVSFLRNHPNYIFTEYIRPSKEFRKYSKKIHTLRLVVLNETGDNPKIVGGYLRLPNSCSGEANYIVLDGTNSEKFNIFTEVDVSNGNYGNAKAVYTAKTENIANHPDTGFLISGTINNYEILKQLIIDISLKMSNLEYMGFDIGITDQGFKCMEINTHPGIKYMQLFRSFYKEKFLKDYIEKKINQIDLLSNERKKIRNGIQR